MRSISRLIERYIYEIGGEDLAGLIGILGMVVIVAYIVTHFVRQRKRRKLD